MSIHGHARTYTLGLKLRVGFERFSHAVDFSDAKTF